MKVSEFAGQIATGKSNECLVLVALFIRHRPRGTGVDRYSTFKPRQGEWLGRDVESASYSFNCSLRDGKRNGDPE
jgi:hypothetical protein